MSRNSLSLGPVPCEEDCAQIGRTPDFARIARVECEVYKAAIIARYGVPPDGAALRIAGHPHDFGRYYELAVDYDPGNEASSDYAALVEPGLARWDDAGFSGPFLYGEGGVLFGTAWPTASAAIRFAVSTLRRRVAMFPASPMEPAALAHLAVAYPQDFTASPARTGE